ncbi:MAG: hypothetical protein IT161_07260 [Bryobacterales bacterium]|nr:hypothetical protein [Bryobacterales bacterium]
MRVKTGLLLAFVVLSNAIGNFLLSLGMHHAEPGSIGAYFQPAVVSGIALLVAWTVSRLYLLGVADLSYVLPVTSVGFVINAWMGAVFLRESVSPARWAGVFLICAGAALAGWTRPDTAKQPV